MIKELSSLHFQGLTPTNDFSLRIASSAGSALGSQTHRVPPAARSSARPGSARNSSGVKSWEPEGQESLGKTGKRTMGQSRAASTQAGEDAVPTPGFGGMEKLEKGTEDVPRTEWPELGHKRRGSPRRVALSWFLCVSHPWFSQSIPQGWHRPGAACALLWQVPAEDTQLIISTNNSGQAKCSLGPPDLWLPGDCMSEDVKMGEGKKKREIWKRAGRDSHHFWVSLGAQSQTVLLRVLIPQKCLESPQNPVLEAPPQL